MLAEEHAPKIVTPVPGPRSQQLAQRLQRHECPDTTYFGDGLPLFWKRAVGVHVWDVDDNRYLDLTSAFGVCTLGHAHPDIVATLQAQSAELIHGMGDVHPSELKVQVAEKLAALAPGDLDVVLFGNSGSEAIEAALKTCAVATRRPGVLAFEGAYHGLAYGALALTWRSHFRAPFRAQLNPHVSHVPFPDRDAEAGAESSPAVALERVDAVLAADDDIGAVFVEPIQGRGGIVVPHASFLPGLREICSRRDRLLVLDEVLTGLGRTGRWFACQHENVQPDLLCVGKSLAGGMPLSACIGSDAVMRSWERSRGEARHTATFLAHPMACAAARTQLDLLEREDWPHRIDERGRSLARQLTALVDIPGVAAVRGVGFLWGVELQARDGNPDGARAARVVHAALQRGWMLLPAGRAGHVLELVPAFVADDAMLVAAIDMLHTLLSEHEASLHGAGHDDASLAARASEKAAADGREP